MCCAVTRSAFATFCVFDGNVSRVEFTFLSQRAQNQRLSDDVSCVVLLLAHASHLLILLWNDRVVLLAAKVVLLAAKRRAARLEAVPDRVAVPDEHERLVHDARRVSRVCHASRPHLLACVAGWAAEAPVASAPTCCVSIRRSALPLLGQTGPGLPRTRPSPRLVQRPENEAHAASLVLG